MFVRLLRDGSLAVAVMSAIAFAQDPAPQGAPRHRSEAKFGAATVVVEHGQPPWSDERVGQMAQIPAGTPWRMGSEGMSTIEIKDAAVFFGDELIEPGRYGLNLLRTAETNWSFLIFEIQDETALQAMGGEPQRQAPAKYVGDAQPVVPALTVDVANGDAGGKCELQWGPMRLTAPLIAVDVVKSEIMINGHEAEVALFRRVLLPETDLTQPILAGQIAMEVDGEDCSMNVYLMLDGGNVVALLRNRERETMELENAAFEAGLKTYEQQLQQFGSQVEARFGARAQDMRRKKDKNEVMLEMSMGRPDNIKLTAPAVDCQGNKLHCDVLKTRSGLKLDVLLPGKKAAFALNENLFELKASG